MKKETKDLLVAGGVIGVAYCILHEHTQSSGMLGLGAAAIDCRNANSNQKIACAVGKKLPLAIQSIVDDLHWNVPYTAPFIKHTNNLEAAINEFLNTNERRLGFRYFLETDRGNDIVKRSSYVDIQNGRNGPEVQRTDYTTNLNAGYVALPRLRPDQCFRQGGVMSRGSCIPGSGSYRGWCIRQGGYFDANRYVCLDRQGGTPVARRR